MPYLVMTPILPRDGKLVDIAALERLIDQALDLEAERVKAEFEKTTATWGDKPAFSIVRAPGRRDIGTDDQKYVYVNEGTGPHLIFPHGKVLAFPGSFVPKTRPGFIGSGAGGKGGKTVFAKGVHHPGTKARKFDEAIAKLWEAKLAKTLEEAISRAI